MDAERIDQFRQTAQTSNRQGLPAGDAPAPVTDVRQGKSGELDPVDLVDEVGRVDVRQEPLAVRDGCAPDRIPIGRWPSDDALVRSEQFAVNEVVGQLVDANSGSLLAVHAPPGTGVAEVFGDLVAAIVTERARRIAELPDPAAAFEASRTLGNHIVAAPAPSLTGFEIVVAAPEASAATAHGLPPIGTRWRDAAGRIDYFASTARLADGVGAWAMLAARLGDGPAREPSVRAAVLAAEEERRTRLADLGAHELDRPALATVTASGKAALRASSALSIAVAGGLRRGKNWRNWSVTRRELRAACARAERRRDAARYGTWLPSGQARLPSGQPKSAVSTGRVWVGMPLRVVRGLDRATVNLRNDLAYDGLLVSDRD